VLDKEDELNPIEWIKVLETEVGVKVEDDDGDCSEEDK